MTDNVTESVRERVTNFVYVCKREREESKRVKQREQVRQRERVRQLRERESETEWERE